MNERQDDSNPPVDETDSLFPAIPQDKPSHLTPRFQFKISTMISWMVVISVALANSNLGDGFHWGFGEDLWSQLDEVVLTLVVAGLFLYPALTCIPMLVDKLLVRENRLQFTVFRRVWMSIALGLFSMLSLWLATIGFSPEWKGSKGPSWAWYLLDGWAGVTLWPIYTVGAIWLICGLWFPRSVKKNPMSLLFALTNAFISFWYVFAVLFLEFAGDIFWVVPGSCGVGYAIYAVLIWRDWDYKFPAGVHFKEKLLGWIAFLGAAIAIKIPLAIRFYESLPDEPPKGCFIVTAATHGHPRWVGSWFDDSQKRILNQQLMTFWGFENWLKKSFPRFHRWLRKIYNRVGPVVARQIRFRWQADMVYLLLKPLEWAARWFSGR